MDVVSWKQVLKEQPELSNMDNWPVLNTGGLNNKQREKFIADSYRVSLVLKGNTLDNVASLTNCSKSTLSKRLNRCLATLIDGEPLLYKGLIPNIKVAKGTIDENILKKKGRRGSFKTLIETIDGLKEYLDKNIKESMARKKSSINLSPEDFHGLLLKYLVDHNHPFDLYPFNEKNTGYESARKYLRKRKSYLICKNKSQEDKIKYAIEHSNKQIFIISLK